MKEKKRFHRVVEWKAARLVVSLGLLAGTGAEAGAGLYKTQKQALAEAFPGGFERKTAFLTEEQAGEVEQRARAKLESKIVTFYAGRDKDGKPMGAAYFDTHMVRTMTETVLVLVHQDGSIRRVEILAFYEPEDYKVRQAWVDRLAEKDLDDEVAVGRDLVRVTGATLSVQALAAAVRRILALHAVLTGVSKS